jgi:hypothetical protein
LRHWIRLDSLNSRPAPERRFGDSFLARPVLAANVQDYGLAVFGVMDSPRRR